MNKSLLTAMVTCILFFVSSMSFAATYDATGLWVYSLSGLSDNDCGEDTVKKSGQTILIQNGDIATLLLEGRTLSGSVNGSIYTFTDYFLQEGAYTSQTITLTLSSDASGGGDLTWTWAGNPTCDGEGQISVDKQSQAPAVYDASGVWNSSKSDHGNNCEDQPNPPSEEGTFTVTQTDNRVTAVDNDAKNYTGWVNGSVYTFATSYSYDMATVTEVIGITLTSQISGVGQARWYWNDADGKCDGTFNISILKQQASSKLTPAIPFLLLDNE